MIWFSVSRLKLIVIILMMGCMLLMVVLMLVLMKLVLDSGVLWMCVLLNFLSRFLLIV